MERTPQAAADVIAPTRALGQTPPPAPAALTPAECHALRRSAPLTRAQFRSPGDLAERGAGPLRR